MDLAKHKLEKAMVKLNSALENIENNKRLAIGELDYVKQYAQEAIWLMITDVDE